jgi:hypothetical protein
MLRSVVGQIYYVSRFPYLHVPEIATAGMPGSSRCFFGEKLQFRISILERAPNPISGSFLPFRPKNMMERSVKETIAV